MLTTALISTTCLFYDPHTHLLRGSDLEENSINSTSRAGTALRAYCIYSIAFKYHEMRNSSDVVGRKCKNA
jgi:hypothetical protein